MLNRTSSLSSRPSVPSFVKKETYDKIYTLCRKAQMGFSDVSYYTVFATFSLMCVVTHQCSAPEEHVLRIRPSFALGLCLWGSISLHRALEK